MGRLVYWWLLHLLGVHLLSLVCIEFVGEQRNAHKQKRKAEESGQQADKKARFTPSGLARNFSRDGHKSVEPRSNLGARTGGGPSVASGGNGQVGSSSQNRNGGSQNKGIAAVDKERFSS
nr:hypothetical protein Iba_chr02bCG17920 [Ipomoea batatas]